VKSPQQANYMYLYRKVLAVQTGGRVMEPTADLIGSPAPGLTDFSANADLVEQINGCVKEARTFYTLTFDPSRADRQDEYHDLELRVNKPGVAARTITGYYDEPYYSDETDPAVRPVSLEQLEQVLNTSHNQPDADLARELSELKLTERLSTPKLQSSLAETRGAKSRQALVALADASVFLEPPVDEISTEAAPDHNTQQRIISLALKYLTETLPNLPNLFATRTTIHYQEIPSFEKGDAKISYEPLHVADTEKDTVVYRNGYEIGEAGTGKGKKRREGGPYLTTYGTFGPLLRQALDAIVQAPGGLSWKRWEQNNGKRLAIFSYVLPEEKSPFDTGGCCLPDGDGTSPFEVRAGYYGEFAIDPATGDLLQLKLVFKLKSTTPLIQSEIMTEYGPVEIGGKSYICPVRGVGIARGRSVTDLSQTLVDPSQKLEDQRKAEWRGSFRTYGPYATTLNDITYGDFHLFRGNSRMLPGFVPVN
jgi:hypothetical protein